MKDITKKLIMGASGVGAMALVGLLLGRKDNSEEEEHDENEVVLDESLVPDEESETEEDTQDENVEE